MLKHFHLTGYNLINLSQSESALILLLFAKMHCGSRACLYGLCPVSLWGDIDIVFETTTVFLMRDVVKQSFSWPRLA